jgi:GNAT superfamily N-acetyltransferase
MTTPADLTLPYSDLVLARRLERAEGHACRQMVDARARLVPGCGSCWIEVAGTYAMYDGAKSPMTQTFGLGLFQPAGRAELERLEAFYQAHQAPVIHEVSPLAGVALLALLNERGYRPVELTSVLYRLVLGEPTPENEPIRVRLIRAGEEDLWAQTSARGWGQTSESLDYLVDLMRVNARRTGGLSFLAELDGQPIATGGGFIHDGVMLMAGASTVPEARRQGAQLALLNGRLRYAAAHGCDLAMMGAEPGSTSQRNAERHGFRIAYTRIKWQREPAAV